METLYTLLVLLHVLSAIAGIGPHFALWILIAQLRSRPETAGALLPVMGRVSMFPRHAGYALLATGVAMVGLRDWALFKQAWIAISLVLLLGMIAAARVLMEPLGRQIGAMLQQGVTGERLDAAMVQLQRFQRLLLLLGAIIVVLMVYQPGA